MTTKTLAMRSTLALLAAGVMAAGCGGGGGSGATTRKVTVKIDTLEASGATFALVLDDSSGHLVSSTAVTSSGTQEVLVPKAGMVSLAAALATNFAFTTFVDPPAGSTIEFHDPLHFVLPTPPPPATFQTWNVTVTPYPGASFYSIFGPCQNLTNTANIASPIVITTKNCSERTSGRILVLALDGGSQPMAWHKTDALPATPGGITNLTVAADQTDIVFDQSSFEGISSSVLLNAGASFTDRDPAFDYFYGYQAYAFTNVPAGQSASGVAVSYPNLGPTRVDEYVGGPNGTIFRERSLDAPPAGTSFDVTGLAVPANPIFDAPTRTFFWQMPLFGFGETLVADLFGPSSTRVIATVVLPAGTDSLTLPELPAALLPSSSALGFSGFAEAIAPDVDVVSSYRDYVEHAGDEPTYVFTGTDGVFLIASQPG